MEKFLFKKVSLWAVGLLIVLCFIGMILFGNIVFHTANGGKKAGIVGDVAVQFSDIPGFLKSLDQNNYYMVRPGTHKGKSGFEFSYEPGTRADAGYLVLSRYDGDEERAYLDFVDLNAQKVLHTWGPDTDAIFAKAQNTSNMIDLVVDRPLSRMQYRHAFVTEDGGMITKMATPLFKVDACNKLVWMDDSDLFHHSIEQDADGNLWTGSHIEPVTLRGVNKKDFLEDGVAAFSQDGELLSNISIPQIFLDNDMAHVVYGGGSYDRDPVHLNDVEPVLEDGPHWKKGDLFLSMRTPSMVMLYRPSTNKILWHQSGPWIHQHDVDILDDHRIAIYDNNSAEFYQYRGPLGNVEVMIYDFNTGEITSPWREALEKLDVVAETEGLYKILPNDELFIEEQNYGRLIRLTKNGDVVWEYVNRAKNGQVFRLGWSRLLDAEHGGKIAKALANANCAN